MDQKSRPLLSRTACTHTGPSLEQVERILDQLAPEKLAEEARPFRGGLRRRHVLLLHRGGGAPELVRLRDVAALSRQVRLDVEAIAHLRGRGALGRAPNGPAGPFPEGVRRRHAGRLEEVLSHGRRRERTWGDLARDTGLTTWRHNG